MIMNKKVKAFLYNFLGYAPFFLGFYFAAQNFTSLTGWWAPVTAAVCATILAPKFQAVTLHGEEKIFMRWLFVKGVKEVK